MQTNAFIPQLIELNAPLFFVGLFITLLLGPLVGLYLALSTDSLRKKDGELLWESQYPVGKWLGRLEKGAFYVCFVVGAEVFIGAWFVFKLGAKWQSWSGVVRLPALKNQSMLDNPEFEFRHRFASWLLIRFLIGTLANVIVGAFGAWTYFFMASSV